MNSGGRIWQSLKKSTEKHNLRLPNGCVRLPGIMTGLQNSKLAAKNLVFVTIDHSFDSA